jgi:hypothetical protein
MPALSALAAKLRLPRRTLRVQLTLLYAGCFFACGVAVLLVPVLTIKQSVPQGASPATIARSTLIPASRSSGPRPLSSAWWRSLSRSAG